MNRADLGQIVGWRLGDRDDMASRIDLELDYLQDYVLERKPWKPWFLLSEWASASTEANESRVPLPGDFLAEAEESHLYVRTPEQGWVELHKTDADIGQQLVREAIGTGFPRAYAVQNMNLVLFPTPGDVYELRMQYYAKATPIKDATVVSPWLLYASDVVLNELLALLAGKHIKDVEAAGGFAGDAQAAWTRLYHETIARLEVNQSRSLGGNS